MIRDKKTAKNVRDILLKCSADLNGSIRDVQQNCSDEEFGNYRRAMSKVLGEILFEGLNPLFDKHPDLKPEGFE